MNMDYSLHAHRAPIPEEDPLPSHPPSPNEEPIPDPDPVIQEPGEPAPAQIAGGID